MLLPEFQSFKSNSKVIRRSSLIGDGPDPGIHRQQSLTPGGSSAANMVLYTHTHTHTHMYYIHTHTCITHTHTHIYNTHTHTHIYIIYKNIYNTIHTHTQ